MFFEYFPMTVYTIKHYRSYDDAYNETFRLNWLDLPTPEHFNTLDAALKFIEFARIEHPELYWTISQWEHPNYWFVGMGQLLGGWILKPEDDVSNGVRLADNGYVYA